MTSQEIRFLLEPPSLDEPQKTTVLYIDSQFQTVEDLAAIEQVLADAKSHHTELSSSLSSSQARLDELISGTRSSAESYVETAQELSLIRHSIADELNDLSERLTSLSSNGLAPTLLEDVETLHRSLKELESIRGYVMAVEHALKLSEAAVQDLVSASSTSVLSIASVAQFQALQSFVSKISEICSGMEATAGTQELHLLSFMNGLRDKTWSNMKSALAAPLLTAAEQIKWPMQVNYAVTPANDRAKFETAFRHMLQLQKIGEQMKKASNDDEGLYPLEALVQPISLRFKYHFEGSRQTNRPDKPEWYFTHILNAIHDHRTFMETVVQQLVSSGGYENIDAWREFTLLVLPLLSRKLRRTVPSLLSHPSLLAHTIYQALSFDASLLETGFSLHRTTGATGEEKWPGTSDVILGKKEWFDAWVEGEKRFAEDQYHEIISASDAWQIADDNPESEYTNSDFKTTNSARRIKALVEQITDRYSALPNFSHRTRFLINVQLPILESYHGRISASLDAFETLSSALVRAVPGALGVTLGVKDDTKVNVDTRRLTSGVEGVQRLCKALLSARHTEAAMEQWGEELFFLELWTEINRRAGLRAQAQAHSALPDPTAVPSDDSQETIFEELVVQYRKLEGRSEDIIVQQVCAEVEAGLKAHFQAISSPNSNIPSSDDDIALSQTLLGPLALLSAHLTYIKATLPKATVTALYRRIASRLAEHILQRQILYRGDITLAEGKTALAESELWVETCQTSLAGALGGGRKRVEAPWFKLLQAGRVVAAEGEMWDYISEATFGGKSEEEWEQVMVDMTGGVEMNREEVGRILRRRET
ncbi:rint-1 family protein [Moniliophthora roreri MCA 2997]|uniref:Rint-1 family protein n=1 Tax=Moniliophthora roreri (strain MCA 2997) TaxID=1381753 RepID=V2YV12_MONRO|nr:rint-1 family protein [Moniliophthora roreri MCA 2997]